MSMCMSKCVNGPSCLFSPNTAETLRISSAPSLSGLTGRSGHPDTACTD